MGVEKVRGGERWGRCGEVQSGYEHLHTRRPPTHRSLSQVLQAAIQMLLCWWRQCYERLSGCSSKSTRMTTARDCVHAGQGRLNGSHKIEFYGNRQY